MELKVANERFPSELTTVRTAFFSQSFFLMGELDYKKKMKHKDPPKPTELKIIDDLQNNILNSIE